MLQASHEQRQLLTQQNSQLQASLQDHQSRVAVLEGNLQRGHPKTSDLTVEVQTLSGTLREMKNQLDTLTTKNKVALLEKGWISLTNKGARTTRSQTRYSKLDAAWPEGHSYQR